MKAQDQSQPVRIVRCETITRAIGSAPKTIVLHVQADSSLEARIENGLSLARACSAHITCLHVTPPEAHVTADSFNVAVMKKALKTSEADLRSTVEARLGPEDVTWDYEQVTGNVARQLISRAALADLLVTAREPRNSKSVGPIRFLGDLVCHSRTPILIMGNNGQVCDPTGSALIAWDGSYEAANSIRSSIGLLQCASAVYVLKVQEKKDEVFPGTHLLEYLSRHGIQAEARFDDVEKGSVEARFVPEILVARALAVDASYLLMGGFNHSRVGEYLFGGVTRSMLNDAPIPIVIGR